MNKLVETIPPHLCKSQKLMFLSLGSNKLCGNIPHGLKSCKSLIQLMLGDNLLTGSLKQLSKILAIDEFLNSLSRVSQAATIELTQGYREESSSEIEKTSFKDQLLDKLNTESGSGFVSIVVASFAPNLVLGFYSNEKYEFGSKMLAPSSSNFLEWVDLLSEDESKLVMADFIKKFVSTVVAVYLERTTTSIIVVEHNHG